MTIRPATLSDAPAIGEIQRTSPEAAQWPPTNDPCFVAVENGAILGFLVVRPVAPDESEVLNLAVAPAARRRGVARALLTHVVTAQSTWFLEVRESNLNAISFYQTAGFRPSGRRENYYDAPRESAIVMIRQK